LQQNTEEAGFLAGKAHINHALQAQAWAAGAWPAPNARRALPRLKAR
jgi:hypothetical protein